MQNVNYILQLLDGKGDIKKARLAIIDLIENHLKTLRKSLGYWEKLYFAEAISSLASNINSSHQPTTSQLRLCLVNIEKALVPPNQRDENYPPRNKQIEALTYEQLAEDLKLLRQLC